MCSSAFIAHTIDDNTIECVSSSDDAQACARLFFRMHLGLAVYTQCSLYAASVTQGNSRKVYSAGIAVYSPVRVMLMRVFSSRPNLPKVMAFTGELSFVTDTKCCSLYTRNSPATSEAALMPTADTHAWATLYKSQQKDTCWAIKNTSARHQQGL